MQVWLGTRGGRQKAAGVLVGVVAAGEDRVTCASRRACLRQPAEQSVGAVGSRCGLATSLPLETRQTKPNQTKPNQQTTLRKGMEKPGGLSSRCSPQLSRPGRSAADPRAQAFAFLGMRSRKQGRAGVGAWRDAKMTICSQKKTVRSRRHKALNWLFCLGRTRDAAAETPVYTYREEVSKTLAMPSMDTRGRDYPSTLSSQKGHQSRLREA